jgi:hypothetical protein
MRRRITCRQLDHHTTWKFQPRCPDTGNPEMAKLWALILSRPVTPHPLVCDALGQIVAVRRTPLDQWMILLATTIPILSRRCLLCYVQFPYANQARRSHPCMCSVGLPGRALRCFDESLLPQTSFHESTESVGDGCGAGSGRATVGARSKLKLERPKPIVPRPFFLERHALTMP